MSATSELLGWLRDFLEDKLTVEQLHWRMEKLIKGGYSKILTEKQRREFKGFFAWCVDMYDPKLQPRPGFTGWIRDTWAQVARGEYRVSIKDVKRKAQQLEALLSERSGGEFEG